MRPYRYAAFASVLMFTGWASAAENSQAVDSACTIGTSCGISFVSAGKDCRGGTRVFSTEPFFDGEWHFPQKSELQVVHETGKKSWLFPLSVEGHSPYDCSAQIKNKRMPIQGYAIGKDQLFFLYAEDAQPVPNLKALLVNTSTGALLDQIKVGPLNALIIVPAMPLSYIRVERSGDSFDIKIARPDIENEKPDSKNWAKISVENGKLIKR